MELKSRNILQVDFEIGFEFLSTALLYCVLYYTVLYYVCETVGPYPIILLLVHNIEILLSDYVLLLCKPPLVDHFVIFTVYTMIIHCKTLPRAL